MKPTILLYLLLFLSVANAQEAAFDPSQPLQEVSIAQWNNNNGLPSNNLTDVFQDDSGLIWITSFNGFVIFDGERMEVYDRSNVGPLKVDGFYQVIDDQEGGLYFASQGSGVIQHTKGNFFALEANGLPLPISISSLFLSKDKTLYMGVRNHGVFQLKDGVCSKYNEGVLGEVSPSAIIEGEKGSLWVGTESNGLYRIKDTGVTHYTSDNGLIDDKVTSLINSDMDGLLIGTFAGLQSLKGEKFVSMATLQKNAINCMMIDALQSIWLGTENGVARWNRITKKLEWIKPKRGIDLVRISSMMQDHEGDIWCTSNRSGLLRIKESMISNLTKPAISSNRVNIIHESWNGNLYIGTDRNQIDVCENLICRSISIKTDLRGNGVRDIYQDQDSSIWLATYAGMIQIHGSKETVYSTGDGMPANDFRTILKDSRGDFWFGSRSGGLVKWRDGEVLDIFSLNNGLQSNYIFSISESNDGNIYVGTHSGGLSIISPSGIVKNYSFSGGNAGKLIFNVEIQPDGGAKVMTNIGLYYYDQKSMVEVDLKSDYKIRTFFDVLSDDFGHIWMTSNNGVLKIDRSSWEQYLQGSLAPISFVTFDENDGMNAKECTGAVKFTKTADGKLYIPTMGGVSIIKPGEKYLEKSDPQVLIRHFEIDDQELDLFDNNLIIPQANYRYKFECSVLNYRSKSSNLYRFKLEGYDKEWSNIDRSGNIEYTNLVEGKYTFKVKGSYDGIVWIENKNPLTFSITPPWWFTWWAKLIWVLLLIGIGRFFYSLRMNALKNQRRRLQTQVANTTKKLRIANEEISKQNDRYKTDYESIKLLSEIGAKIISTLSIDTIIERVYESVNDLMIADVFDIGLYQQKDDSIYFPSGFEKGKKLEPHGYSLQEDVRMAVQCFKWRKVILTNDTIKDYPIYPNPIVGEPSLSAIYLPLIQKDEVIGVISVQSFTKHSYTKYHVSLLKNLAVYISIAIENANNYRQIENANLEILNQKNEYKKNHDSIKALSEVGSNILSTLSLRAINTRIYESVRHLSIAEVFTIGIYNPKSNTLDFHDGMEKDEELEDFSYHIEKDADRFGVICFLRQEFLLCNNLEMEFPDYPKPLFGEQPSSCVIVPLVHVDECIGVISVQSFRIHAYTEYDVYLLKNLAVYISIAIQNAKVLTQIEGQVAQIKKSEQQLLENEAGFKDAFQLARLASWKEDVPSDNTNLTKEYCDILGIEYDRQHPYMSKSEFYKTFIYNEDKAIVNSLFKRAIQTKNKDYQDKLNFRIEKSGGEIAWVSGIIRTRFNANGKVNGIYGTIQDITKIKQAEEELKSQAEILQSTNKKLVELDEYREAMTGMIVHDFKNSLNTVINFSGGEPTKRRLKSIQQAGQFMLHMVLNILDVQKFETTSVKLSLANYPVSKMVNAAIDQLSYLIDQKSIYLIYHQNDDLYCRVDYELITRAIVNILSNAIKYVSTNGDIEISVQDKNDTVLISVKDNGQGISPEHLGVVFDKYSQINAKKSGSVRSTGIGLTFCKMVVEAHDCIIDASSIEGEGSTFYFSVPKIEHLEGDASPIVKTKSKKGRKVVFTKDEKDELVLIIEELKKWEVYDYSEVVSILESMPQENENVNTWKDQIRKALYNGNEAQFIELLNI